MANNTPNLLIPHIATGQSQKEVTANTAFDDLDTAMTASTSISVAGSADVTPATATMLLGFNFVLTGVLTGNIHLIVPAAQKFYRFYHTATGGYTVTVKVAGSGIVLSNGDERLLYCDGTTVFAGDNSGGGGGSTTPSVNNQTASYTAVLGDANNIVTMNVGSGNNFTVPPNSSVAFAVGTSIVVIQKGAGQTTLVPGSGVTINNPSSLTARTQWSSISVTQIATDVWVAAGDLT